MYVRGNPLRYTDPSGHCAVLDDGSADREGDAGCWQAADEWHKTFGNGDYETEEEWLKQFASSANITEEILRKALHAHWSPRFRQWGVYHTRFNPTPTDFVSGPQHPIGPITESAWDVLSGRCEIVDCTGLVIDAVGFASTVIAIGASPLCGPAAPGCAAALKTGGTVVSSAATIGGVGRVVARASNGNASGTDVVVSVVNASLSFTPVAPVSGGIQIAYDVFVSPYTIMD